MNQPAKQSLRSAETIPPQRATDSASVPLLLFVTLPTQFGRFRVERLLGRGAMGEVYLAWDTQLERAVALKVPRLTGAEDSDIVQRLLREAKSAASLDHPNICRVYDVGHEAGTAFIAMQFIEGRPLSDYIAPGHFQNERQSVDLVRKLASALVEAHAKGIIHRDLKPANILVNERGEPILMDFGLARRADSARDGRATQAGMLIGSPAYMSPEQANGEIDKIGPWSDLYSLGVLLFELLTNQLPFQGSVLSILSQIATKEPPLPSSLRPGLDPRLDVICRRMMAKHPQDRFASMIEVEQVLTSWLSGTTENVSQADQASRRASAPGLLKSEISNLKSQISKSPGADALRLASPPPISLSTASVAKKSIAAPNDIAQQQERAKQFLAKRDYEAAIPLLTKLSALKEPQFQETATWAKQTLPTAQEQHQKLREAAVSACQKARALRRQCDYAGAVQVLELIPVAARTTELQQLLAESTDLADECSSLRQEIDESLKRKKYSRLRSLLERYLKLKPDSPKMERLLRNLEKNHPARAVANFQETRTYYDVAGRLFTPRDLFLIVFVFAIVLLSVSYTFIGYLAKTGNGEPQVAVADVPKPQSKPTTSDAIVSVAPVLPNAGVASTVNDSPRQSQPVSASLPVTLKELLTLKGHTGAVTSVSFSADGKLASASADRTVKLWDVSSGQEALTLNGHTDWGRSVAFSADGKRLASASYDQTVKVWDAANGQESLTLKGHTGKVLSVAFSADGKQLASASYDQTVKVWDAESGQESLMLRGHIGPVTSVAFSVDGKRLASSSGETNKSGEVKVWDATSGQETLTLKGHTNVVTSVAFSTDGKRLASAGSDDLTVKVWDATNGQVILTLKGHTRRVHSVAFSADGKRLASAGGEVKVWDVTSGLETLTLNGHPRGVFSVAFSADGKRLASASLDQTIKVWDVTPR